MYLQQDFKKKSDMHWARKVWHMAGVSLIAVLYILLPEGLAKLGITLAWLSFVPADYLRQRNPVINEKVVSIFKPIMRQYELKGFAGTTFLLTGVSVVIFLFPRSVVIPTLFFLAFADPIASYFGIRFGKDKIFGQKSLQGTLAAFAVCFLVMFIFLNYAQILTGRMVLVSVIAGVIGALAELIPIGDVDDNLTLPVISAIGLFLIFSLFGAL